MAAAEKLATKGQAWFCTTGLPSDVVIEVGDMSFHLHKFPLMDKSRKLHRLITEKEEGATRRRRRRGRRVAEEIEGKAEEEEREGEITEETKAEEEEREGETTEETKAEEEEREDDDSSEEDEDEPQHVVSLPNFPGGAEIFEAAAKFCYGVKVELTAWNVALLRCAGEYLEMTEDVCEDNLISRTERFLAQYVLRSLKESIKTLKSCEDLLPLADDLGIVQRCVDVIAARAASVDSSSLFGWPLNEGRGSVGSGRILWNGIDTGVRRRSGMRSSSGDVLGDTENAGGADWLEDLATLSLTMYKRVIAALKEKGLNSDTIERALLSYAKRSIPGLSRATRRRYSSAPVASEAQQRELLETVITNLPQESASHRPPATIGAVATTKFLLGLLRTANILRASEASIRALERKIGSQLELATLDDLLIPSYSYLAETLYDVDCVERMLAHFLADSGEGVDDGGPAIVAAGGSEDDGAAVAAARVNSLRTVGKLLDGYLAEIASDANLKADKFCGLVKALPGDARVYHDGLYRAVDIYLKTHPRTTEAERERVCGVMDCRKLTLEACTHAAQNERLPLRAVVQVLFFEQLQLRRAIAGTLLAAGAGAEAQEGDAPSSATAAAGTRGTWRAAIRENQVLRLDIDSMRNRVQELERECSDMKKALGRLDGGAAARAEGGRMQRWSKLGCRFSTQVCDSHERNVVQSRTSRLELSP